MGKSSTSIKKGEIRNPYGRPKKNESITELVKKFLRSKPKGQKRTYKEMFVERVTALALKGDLTAIKLIWNYLDGMPQQTITNNIKTKNSILEKLDAYNPDNTNIS